MDRGGGHATGLNRSGKSCRMRWVNYLHPSRKHGRLSPQEERLVIELHARWGNSWSRIARRLPGRTDNDIKNYWKTRMRMKAQERETSMSPSSLTTYTSCLLDSNSPVDVMSCGDTHNNFSSCIIGSALESTRTVDDGFVMDQIWREMETPLQAPSLPQVIHQADEKTCSSIVPLCTPATTAAMWDDQCPEVFWNMDAEEIRMLAPQFDCAES
ncbi:hypothetical protein BDA96_05G242200 [Sorghum bicolor]|uniref:Uncharacterized protein n=3 Tax=Sorghum bicolor TaxID=4558 RepID=A0A921QZE3_SORBI|nr:hypothetical protein BDA96_05G242200 [Sorghum bicolor]